MGGRAIRAVVAAIVLGGTVTACAATVAGTAEPAPGASAAVPRSVATSGRTEQPPAELTTSDTAHPSTASRTEESADGPTGGTDTSAQESSSVATAAATGPARQTSATSAATEERYLRKAIGQMAGLTNEAGQQLMVFWVTAIQPGFETRCDKKTAPVTGQRLIGVKIKYQVSKDYDPNAGNVLTFEPGMFALVTSNRSLESERARSCLTKNVLPTAPLTSGQNGEGWVVLDVPSGGGMLQMTQPDLDGGWEWVIPKG